MTLNFFFSVDVKVYWFLDRLFSCWPYYFRKTYHNTSFCLSVSVYKFYLYSPSSISTSKISHVTEDGDWSGVCLSRLCQHNFEHNMETENEHNFKLFSKKSTAGIICFFNSKMWTIFVICIEYTSLDWIMFLECLFLIMNCAYGGFTAIIVTFLGFSPYLYDSLASWLRSKIKDGVLLVEWILEHF